MVLELWSICNMQACNFDVNICIFKLMSTDREIVLSGSAQNEKCSLKGRSYVKHFVSPQIKFSF